MPTALPAAARFVSAPRTSQSFMPAFILLAILGIALGTMMVAEIEMSPRSIVQKMQLVGESAACESGSCLIEATARK